MNGESPGKKIRKKFFKNKLAVFGLLVIVLSFFIAIFCYLIMPDHSPMANRMNLPIGNQPPGFRVEMLLVKKNFIKPSSFLTELFSGRENDVDMIPINRYRFEGNELVYNEFTGDATDAGREKRIAMVAVVYGDDVKVSVVSSDGSSLNLTSTDGTMIHATRADLRHEIQQTNIIVKRFILGTDRYGRDLLSRLLAGTRVTVSVGLIAVLISLFIGISFGALAGFFRGWVDETILWLINVVWSIPTLLLVIAMTLVLGKGFEQVFIAVGFTMWVEVARIVRGQLFSIRELEFIDAGRALGFRNARIIVKHILPNIFGPVIVVAASNFSAAVLLEAGLSFLGIGAQPPIPSWGAMIKENYGYIIIPQSAYLAVLPGLAIMLLAMAFAFVGNGLRDALDSKNQVRLT